MILWIIQNNSRWNYIHHFTSDKGYCAHVSKVCLLHSALVNINYTYSHIRIQVSLLSNYESHQTEFLKTCVNSFHLVFCILQNQHIVIRPTLTMRSSPWRFWTLQARWAKVSPFFIWGMKTEIERTELSATIFNSSLMHCTWSAVLVLLLCFAVYGKCNQNEVCTDIIYSSVLCSRRNVRV